MATKTFDFKRSENKARSLIVGALGATLLLAALAPQNTRAVFITDGGLPGAKAFTATVGPNRTAQRLGNFLSGAADPRGPLGTRSRGIPGAGGFIPAAPSAIAPGTSGAIPPVDVAENTVAQPPLTPAVQSGPVSGTTGGVQPFAPGMAQPVAGAPGFGVVTPGTPGGNPGTPTTPGTPETPVSAVPEPTTWTMLLGGFLLIGCALRMRRRDRPQAA